MAKVFSLASWNVEHFKGQKARVKRVVDFLRAQDAAGGTGPDVIALYEVEGKDVYDTLVGTMPRYTFHITEGAQTQEILIGVKQGLTAFFSQRAEFKTGNRFLRPGALLSLRLGNKDYSLMFLHTKAGSKPIGLGLRDEMFAKTFKLKRALDKRAGGKGKARFLFLGDLNTAGMKYGFKSDIANGIELKKLQRDAKKVRMTHLVKSYPATWWNGPGSKYPPTDFDHVVASDNLKFKSFPKKDAAVTRTPLVDVRGWPDQPTDSAKGKWINRFSDHALLYIEIHD